jgi:uncharacterized protein
MVHLLPLPGSPRFAPPIDRAIEAALRDARAIESGGADGIVFENFGDVPFAKHAAPETIAAMTRVITEVVRETRLPFGVNVLRNDGVAALGIAAATGASFIRVNVLAAAMLTDQGIVEGEAAAVLRKRKELGTNALVFADHLVKHAVQLAPADAVQSAKDLRLRALADAIIVTGKETGAEADSEMFELLRAAVDAPLLVGSGLTAENAPLFGRIADGAIVGTSIKAGGEVGREVDARRVEQLLRRFKSGGR